MRRLLFIVCAFLCGGFGSCETPEQAALMVAGYTMLSPPSNLFAPGAVVMMDADEHGRAQLRLVCGPRASLGPSYSPRVSETMSSSLKLTKRQRVSLEAEAVERFRSRTQVDDVESVTVNFSSPKVLELSEDDVFEGIRHRSEACRKAIETRLANGFAPSFITSAYIADVEYLVTFKRQATISKSAKERRMGQIAASLGGGHTNITEKSLRAVNLILAIRSDDYLVHIRDDGSAVVEQSNGRSLEPGYAEALPGADAPFVPPAGGWPSPIIGG